MFKKNVMAIGAKTLKPPVAVLSQQALRDMFQLPQKKVATSQISIEKFICAIPTAPSPTSKKTADVLRGAIMDAVNSPRLRAVIGIFFTKETVSVKIIHPVKNRLSYNEINDFLLLVHDRLIESPFQDVEYFIEENATHMLTGADFADPLLDHLMDDKFTTVMVLNLFHDYVRMSHNMIDPVYALLQTMYIMGKKE
jgi:hypothetical protein